MSAKRWVEQRGQSKVLLRDWQTEVQKASLMGSQWAQMSAMQKALL